MSRPIAHGSAHPGSERYQFARRLTVEALKLGLGTSPCEDCGADLPKHYGSRKRRVVAHHDSYMRPLEIRWLCYPCHRNWHIAHGSGEGRNELISLSEKQRWLDELVRLHGPVAAEADEPGSAA